MVTLGDVAAHLGLSPGDADPGIVLEGIAPLSRASSRNLAFIADSRYLEALRQTAAGCVITREEWKAESPVPVLCAADPYLAYARVSSLFDNGPRWAPGVHPTAVVDPSAVVPDSVSVGAHACVEAGVVLGEDVVIGPGCFVGRDVRLGTGTFLAANVVLYHDVALGEYCRVHSATVIGADGFGFARRPDGWERISQLGGVRIGDRVDIGASCTVDRGALDHTVICDDVIIDDQVHIAHNCRIGERTAIAGCVGIAGSTRIGADCTFAGQVGVSGHLEICDNVNFSGQARVARPVSEPGTYASGTPLETAKQWGRNAVRFRQLDAMHRRLAALEHRLAALDGAAHESDAVAAADGNGD